MHTAPDSFIDYQHEIVRDLAWLIRSPELMTLPEQLSSAWLFEQPDHHQVLCQLDQEADLLAAQLRQQASYRLGFYFEDLVTIYLKKIIQPIELKTNIQVKKNKNTVGEYDFLMRLNNGEQVHLETAVKFYLYSETQGAEGLSAFIGPNRSDRLDKKWARLMGRQLKLSQTPSGIEQACALGLLPNRRSLLLKGYLFYPYSHWQSQPLLSPLHPAHARGWWLKASESHRLHDQQIRYAVLMKPRWLAPARVKLNDSITYVELLNTVVSLHTPLLIAELERHDQSGEWCERSRGFIVPDNWDNAEAGAK